MKIKPKEILVNLHIALTFKDYHEIPIFAANINSIIHGKTKIKCEEVGIVDGQYIGIFYLQRNDEYHELRKSFLDFIEENEVAK